MIKIDKKLEVGDTIVFFDYCGNQIKGKVVEKCKGCRYVCIKREDGLKGGGCNRDWVINPDKDEIRILNTNPNNDIIIKE